MIEEIERWNGMSWQERYNVAADELEKSQASVRKCAEQMSRLNRTATDRQYMIEALVQMLGPVALKVWQGWQDSGVTRVHHSWGAEAWKLTGEERAQVLLDIEAAPRRPVESLDGNLATARFDDAFPKGTE